MYSERWKMFSMILESSNFEDFCLIKIEIVPLQDLQNTCPEFAEHNNI